MTIVVAITADARERSRILTARVGDGIRGEKFGEYP
jgi:hypothetical protein